MVIGTHGIVKGQTAQQTSICLEGRRPEPKPRMVPSLLCDVIPVTYL